MSAIDTAKEFVRLGSTVGLSKDVIDLLDKKASLLAEQVTALEQENTTLLRENRNLKLENDNLKNELQKARPNGKVFDDKTLEMLKLFFNTQHEVTISEIARHFNLSWNLAKYHMDLLVEKRLISSGGFNMSGGGVLRYGITSLGHKFVVERGLANG